MKYELFSSCWEVSVGLLKWFLMFEYILSMNCLGYASFLVVTVNSVFFSLEVLRAAEAKNS